ncbi:MAG TPA: phosphoribosyltransferase family protein [Candidatus Binataceae bacterium]|nr:phosphoribosyltransferase family protein [Candidatus Binataceae bacterium]
MGQQVVIPSDSIRLEGELSIPERAVGVVLFAHGSGSSRLSPRNRVVAEALREAGLGTLLFDLLTEDEAAERENVFDIDFLAHRLADATRWLRAASETGDLPLGYFGASTGAAAALVAASQDRAIRAVVSRGGRPDLAIRHLAEVASPTLLIVGGNDYGVIELNEKAYRVLRCEKSLKIVAGATHLFEEPGTLEQVAALAIDWFTRHLTASGRSVAMRAEPIVYATREAAGRRLAQRLQAHAAAGKAVVLGLARGGLPVAKEIADALDAALDVIVVRKLGAPGEPELGIGAVVDGDHPRAIFNQDIIAHLAVPRSYIEGEIELQLKEVKRREAAYRGDRAKVPLAGRTVIVVDDGIATGSSIRAALRGIRRQQPARLILAVPVAPPEIIEALRGEADEIVCLETPAEFYAVGQFYRDFHQVSDDEVKAILQSGRPAASPPQA